MSLAIRLMHNQSIIKEVMIRCKKSEFCDSNIDYIHKVYGDRNEVVNDEAMANEGFAC